MWSAFASCLLLVASLASPASASELTPEGETHVGDVRDLLYAGSTTQTRPAPANQALVDEWRADELAYVVAPPPSSPAGPGFPSEIETLRRASKLKWGLRVLGRASLVATAGTVGWEIGSIIADEIYNDELPAKPDLPGWDPNFAAVFAAQKGDCIQFAGYPGSWAPPSRQGLSDAAAYGACTTGGGVSDDLGPGTLRAPSDGWVLTFREADGFGDYYTVQWGPGPEGDLNARLKSPSSASSISGCRQIQYPLVGAALQGFQLIGALTASGQPWFKEEYNTWTCGKGAVTPEVITARPYVWFKPADGWSRSLEATDQPDYGPFDGTVPDPGTATVDQAIRDNLCEPGFQQVANFVARQLGVAVCDNQPQPHGVPDCRGQTYAECSDDLEGIDVEVVRETRPIQDVLDEDIDLGAGAVVETAPAEGENVLPGDAVDVVTNPERPDQEPQDDGNQQDPDCDYPQGSVPANWDPLATAFTPAPLTSISTSVLGIDPDVDGSPKPVILRYGDAIDNWGGRHVVERHGWNPAAERDTRLTIAFGYRDANNNDAWRRTRRYTILLPQRNAGGKVCGRRVIAQLGYNPADAVEYPDVDGREKGIITSFGFARL